MIIPTADEIADLLEAAESADDDYLDAVQQKHEAESAAEAAWSAYYRAHPGIGTFTQ
jgi:predicted HAD superfamily Cof-like phosphohydrolase